MAAKVNHVKLFRDAWSRGTLQRTQDIIGLDVAGVNIEVEVGGGDLPDEIEVQVRTREPGNRTGDRTTIKPVNFTIPRSGRSKSYRRQLEIAELGAFLGDGDAFMEVATVVRNEGTSDAFFRYQLKSKWALRGTSVQRRTGGIDTGNEVLEQPNALKLFLAGGVEVLEVSVLPQAGLTVSPVKDQTWAFIRSPADVFYYSGHGWWDGDIVDHPSYDKWLSPGRLLKSWRVGRTITNSPMDLDVLIMAGCSVLEIDPQTKKGPGRAWAKLLVSKQGPLRVLLSNYGITPLDSHGGNQLAERMAIQIAKGLAWDQYVPAWLGANKELGIKVGCGIDEKGYWYQDPQTGDTLGPIALP